MESKLNTHLTITSESLKDFFNGKVAYVCISKSGSSTVKTFMSQRLAKNNCVALYYRQTLNTSGDLSFIKQRWADIKNDYKTFAFLRNPYERFASSYFYVITARRFDKEWERIQDKYNKTLSPFNLIELCKNTYSRGSIKGLPGSITEHTIPQTIHIRLHTGGNINDVSLYMPVEKINEVIRTVSGTEMPKRNTNTIIATEENGDKLYLDNPGLFEAVSEYFKEDIEFMNSLFKKDHGLEFQQRLKMCQT